MSESSEVSLIIYTYDDHVEVDEVFSLLDKMELQTSTKFPASAVFHRALRNRDSEFKALAASICITARAEGELVGFLRLVGDGAYIYYVLDVMVNPDLQGRGIGKKLVELARDQVIASGFMKLFLTAIPGAEQFYEAIGFKPTLSPVLTIRGEDHIDVS